MQDEDKNKISEKELISGRIYTRKVNSEELNELGEFLNETFLDYSEKNKAKHKIYKPYETITLVNTANTIVRPILAVKRENSSEQLDLVIDYAKNNSDVLAFCIKPVIYKEAGISEYWVLDLENKQIIIYNLNKDGFVPTVIMNPRRIKVGIFNSLLLNYSDLFREIW